MGVKKISVVRHSLAVIDNNRSFFSIYTLPDTTLIKLNWTLSINYVLNIIKSHFRLRLFLVL